MRSRAGTLVRAGLVVVVLVLLAREVWTVRDDIARPLVAIGPGIALLALTAAFGGLVIGMLGWRVLLAGLGTSLPLDAAARLYFVSGLGKYLPGGLWPALGHAETARRMGEPPLRLAFAFLASVALSVATGLALGMLVLPGLDAGPAVWTAAATVVAVIAVPVVVPSSMGRLVSLAGRILRRPSPSVSPPGVRSTVTAALLIGAGWAVSALHVPLLAVAVGGRWADLWVLAGGFVLAGTAGVLAFVLPAGLGAREVVLGVVLSTVLPAAAVVAVVATSRVVVIAADVAAAALAALLSRSTPARPLGVPSSTPTHGRTT